MIRATLATDRLIITADNAARAGLAILYTGGDYTRIESAITEELYEQFSFVAPENVGALTDSPILAESDSFHYEDSGLFSLHDGARLFWFPNYMIRDPWEELKNHGRVEFEEAS